MKPARRVSKSGLELIKRFEGYRASAARLADGRWTVGYGHVHFAKPGVELSEADAETLLIYDLMKAGQVIEALVEAPLGQNQFDALSSFVFNVGFDNFKSSSVLRQLKEGDLAKAAFAIEMWRRAAFEQESVVVEALVRRRAAEKALFLKPDEGYAPAPTPVLPPEIDLQAPNSAPVEIPATLIASLDGQVAQVERASRGTLQIEAVASEPAGEADPASQRLRAIIEEDAASAPDEPAAIADPEPVQPTAAGGPELVDRYMVPNDLMTIAAGSEIGASKSPWRLVAFSAAGLVLFGSAVFLRLQSESEPGGAGQTGLSYIAGILGIICIFYAAYLLLERFAGAED